MKIIYLFISFLVAHIALGRKISIPYGMAAGGNMLLITVSAFILDIIQIPFFLYVYTHTSNIPILQKIKVRMMQRSEGLEQSRFIKWAKRMGKIGTIIVAAIPFQGGGMWSGVLLAYILKLKKWQTYLLLSFGSLLGCIIMAVGMREILSFF
ncbi:MAG: small multi-drug export protein [Candidatus Methanofastidiosia archaeon]